MNAKIEIPLHNKSEQYLREILAEYKETKELPSIIKGRCIIHMYPYEDTYEDDGCLVGYIDAIHCELHIYDIENKTVYKTKMHDEIRVDVPCRVRIFKDLSTMLIFDTPVSFNNWHSFEVLGANE